MVEAAVSLTSQNLRMLVIPAIGHGYSKPRSVAGILKRMWNVIFYLATKCSKKESKLIYGITVLKKIFYDTIRLLY